MKAELSAAQRRNLPDSAFACPEKRLYPIHDKAHVRNALARIADPSNDQCGRDKIMAAARSMGISTQKGLVALKAHPVDDDSFRLLAIPFGGPIPKPGAPRGADLDGEWFSERTDIKADWFPFRPVDWHHRADPAMGGTIFGKAVLDEEPEDDGWWVTVWLKHGEKRLDLVRRLASRGGELFGSSEAVPRLVRKADTGEILTWPYIRQALSTSPQNTYSVIRPLKATLDDLYAEGEPPTAAFFSDLERLLDNLTTQPDSDLTGEETAKAGRVLAARNEARLRDGIAALDERGWDPVVRKRALSKIAEVLDELTRYVNTPEETT